MITLELWTILEVEHLTSDQTRKRRNQVIWLQRVEMELGKQTLQLIPHSVHKCRFLPSKNSKPNVAEDNAENGAGALRNFTAAASEPAPAWASRGTRRTMTPGSQESRAGRRRPLLLHAISQMLAAAAVGAGCMWCRGEPSAPPRSSSSVVPRQKVNGTAGPFRELGRAVRARLWVSRWGEARSQQWMHGFLVWRVCCFAEAKDGGVGVARGRGDWSSDRHG